MFRTVEAVIDEHGQVHLLEEVKVSRMQRAFVTILDEDSEEKSSAISETALLSEQALAEDWNRPEEDEAWSHLQPEK